MDFALHEIKTYAQLGLEEGDITFSPEARRLLFRLFGSFGPRTARSFERALRVAAERFIHANGPRCVRLRTDLVVELALVTKVTKLTLPNADTEIKETPTILARFMTSDHIKQRNEELAAQPHEELLSPRQRQVARLAAGGESIPTIARMLVSSPESVRVHMAEVYRRLGIATRVELAMFYAVA